MQGNVEPEAAAKIAGKLYEMGCYEVSMGDTIGVGTPASVAEMFKVCSPTAHVWCVTMSWIADCDTAKMHKASFSISAVVASASRSLTACACPVSVVALVECSVTAKHAGV